MTLYRATRFIKCCEEIANGVKLDDMNSDEEAEMVLTR